MASPRMRRVAKRWLPPAVADAIGGTTRHLIRFQVGYATWADASTAASGYDDAQILSTVQEATRAVISGDAEFERDGVTFAEPDYRWPIVASLLDAAARHDGSLRVMDFGGSLGSTYFQNRAFLAPLEVRWGVVEQAGFVTAGQEFADSRLSFHETITACATAVNPTIAVLSSVLQYLPDPHGTLADILTSSVDTVLIDRTPMTDLEHDLAAVQSNPGHAYSASYAAWLLSRSRLLDQCAGWSVIGEFPGIEPPGTASDGTPVAWSGLLLRRD